MDWLNYHHLHYFWTTARLGGVGKAAKHLRLAQPTVSAQLRALERSLGQPLYQRRGRGLELTDVGQTVFRYADEIFGLGRQLVDAVQGRATGKPVRWVVGVADVLPKLVVRELLRPVLAGGGEVQLVCKEDRPEQLLSALARHELDVVLTDAPIGAGSHIRAFTHLLGECGTSFFAAAKLGRGLRKRFPQSLAGAPFLAAAPDTGPRRLVDGWLEDQGLRPRVVAEFDDSALLKVFAEDGAGVFAAPTIIEAAVCKQYGVQVVGRVESLRDRFYAISVERRIRHPLVAALTQARRAGVFR